MKTRQKKYWIFFIYLPRPIKMSKFNLLRKKHPGKIPVNDISFEKYRTLFFGQEKLGNILLIN